MLSKIAIQNIWANLGELFSTFVQVKKIASFLLYIIGGFPIKIETEITLLISYSFAIFIV